MIFQPNPSFESEKQMYEWLKVNVPGAKIMKKWRNNEGRIACEVDTPPIVAPKNQPKVKTKKKL